MLADQVDVATCDPDDFCDSLPFRPDGFQLDAARAISEGLSVLVAAPTGAGKTVVADYAAELAMSRGQRLFYTTPIKALSNQKFRDLRDVHGIDNVGLLTGDNSINADAPLVVMTTEVLRNMIYEGSRRLSGLSFVVLDEVHYLQDRYRGATWEEVIIELPPKVLLVCLSATVSNVDEFGAWLREARGETEVIVDNVRPVPLHNLYAFEDRAHGALRLMPVFSGEAKAAEPNSEVLRILKRMRRGDGGHSVRSPRRIDVVEELAYEDALPAIYFIFSRAACEDAARTCVAAGLRLARESERKQIRAIAEERIAEFPDSDLDALGFDEWVEGLEAGVATHHAGLIPAFKEVVEELFIRALVKVVFATETLSLGINMPARSVVIESLSKFNGKFHTLLTPGEFTQLSGRAGRRGKDSVGYCVTLHSRWVPFSRVAEVAGSRAYELVSSFTPSYNMATNLVSTRDRDAAEMMLRSSFAHFRTQRSLDVLKFELDRKEAARAELHDRAGASDPGKRRIREERDAHMMKQTAKLKRRIERRQGGLVGEFNAIIDVLLQLGYVDRWALTKKGRFLRAIYCERDLLVAEALDRGVDQGLRQSELAALASCFVFEARQSGRTGDRPGTSGIARALSKVRRIWREVAIVEESHKLEAIGEPDSGFAELAYRWAEGEGLDTLLAEGESAGDFVRNAKQVADICRQIALAGGGGKFDEAAQLMNRGVVAYSSI